MTYIKTLRPFKKKFTKRYVQQLYPLFADFVDQFLLFMESTNYTEWFPVTDRDNMTTTEISEQRNNSLYLNIIEIIKFGNIDDIPIKNKKLLYTWFLNYAAGFNLDDYILDLQDDENIREFIRYANIMSRLKGTHKAFSFFINLIRNHKIGGVNKTVELEEYFVNSTDSTEPPLYSYISSNTDKIILTDVPCYYLDGNGDIQKTTITSLDKGKYPFTYQIVSAAPIFAQNTFVKNFKTNIHPAGWEVNILTKIEDLEGVGYGGADITTTTKPIKVENFYLTNVNIFSNPLVKTTVDTSLGFRCYAMCVDDDYIYASVTANQILILNKDLTVVDFKTIDNWVIGAGAGSITTIYDIVVDENYLYCLVYGVATENGDNAYGVIKINKTTLVPVSSGTVFLAQDNGGGSGTASGIYKKLTFDDNDVLQLFGDDFYMTRLDEDLNLTVDVYGQKVGQSQPNAEISGVCNISGTGVVAAGKTTDLFPCFFFSNFTASTYTVYKMAGMTSGEFLSVTANSTHIFCVGSIVESGVTKAIVSKYDLTGTQVKCVTHNIFYGQSTATLFNNVGIDQDGNIIAAGYISFVPNSRLKIWIVKFDTDLNVINEKLISDEDPFDDIAGAVDPANLQLDKMILFNDQVYGSIKGTTDLKFFRVDMDINSYYSQDGGDTYWIESTSSDWEEDAFTTSSTSVTTLTSQQYADFAYTLASTDETLDTDTLTTLSTDLDITYNNSEMRLTVADETGFQEGEKVTGAISEAFGLISSIDTINNYIYVNPTTGTFQTGETITGKTTATQTTITSTIYYSSINYPSNYNNAVNNTDTITKTDAEYVRVHFGAFDTEFDTDFVYIKDTSDNVLAMYSGNVGEITSVAAPGDTIKVNFITTISGVDTGWYIDKIEWQQYT